MSSRINFEQRESAFNRRLYSFAIVNLEHIDIRDFLTDAFEYFDSEVRGLLGGHLIIKLSGCFSAEFEKIIQTSENELREKQTIYIHTCNLIIDSESDLTQIYEEDITKYILSQIDSVIMQGSGFSLSQIKELTIQVSRYEPLRASSFVETPKDLVKKNAIVNILNYDEMCFKWAILSALYPVTSNPRRLSNYIRYENELNFTGIEFPVKLNQILKFEQLNPSISINVYIYEDEDKKVRPVRITKDVKVNHIHLLLIMKEVRGSGVGPELIVKSHYCWIKNLSRLISSQVSKHNGQHFFCDRCLNFFQSLVKLVAHRENCRKQNEYEIEMPTEANDIIEFQNYEKKLDSPFIIYADVEALLKKPDHQFCKNGGKKEPKTVAYQQHEVYSIGYYFKCSYDDSKSFYKSHRGVDCVDWFVLEMKKAAEYVGLILNRIIPLKMTILEELGFYSAKKCHICEKPFERGAIKVRDHSHLTGAFRGAAHQDCNIQYVESRTIPVVFHNLTHYDSHFLLRKLGSGFDGDISIIPLNVEKYISFTKTVNSSANKYHEFVKLRFIDSFRFMANSLDYLSSLIPSEEKKILRSECAYLSEKQLRLLERKGVFCYDYVDSWEKLDEMSLPSKDLFHSTLTDKDISDEDYDFAKEIWNEFNIKTLGEYSDLYMKTDILLLADIFENFRKTCKEIYKLDPSNYYTAPGLSFDAMLRFTNVKLELLKDIDMLLFVERGIRGGISQCSQRYAKANNRYLENFDENEETSYLMYLDANNLYGHSMMQYLPHNNYQWANNDFSAETILRIPDDAGVGYIFEVDLDYPANLHDLHNDYPFCAENRTVPGTGKSNMKKLLLTLYDKKNYVVHYRMLKLALQHGIILKKIHRVLQFNQSDWLKPYIMLNTEMRTKATNDFEKNFFKLLCNAIFGKHTCQICSLLIYNSIE